MNLKELNNSPITFDLSDEDLESIRGGAMLATNLVTGTDGGFAIRNHTLNVDGGFAIRNHTLNVDGGFAIRNHTLKV